jgi:hypothetical protein
MKPPPFFVVADRGHIKAYHIEQSAGCSAAATLAEKLDLDEAHLKYEKRFTDQAGAFPSRSAPGIANGAAERMSMEGENNVRIYKHLAQQLVEWLKRYQPKFWGFAAPCEINHAVLHELPPEYHKNLILNLKHDLVKVPAAELLQRLTNKSLADNSLPVVG